MEKKPIVGIIMGSDSDLPVMKDAAVVLEALGVPYELEFVSAHRTADRMREYAKQARNRGIKIVIAGAGGSAHLPGMTEAFADFPMPIIAVPIKTSSLAGIDSLFSMVQMPPGRPVAVMPINGSKNAGLYAAHMLALSDDALAARVEAYKTKLATEVDAKNEEVKAGGWKQYLEDHGLL